MRSSGTWLFSWSACWPARALFLWVCIALLLLPSPIFAQNPTERLNSIEQSLTAILAYSQKLGEELQNSQQISEEQRKHIEQLLIELADLRIRLEASRLLLEKYRQRVDELLTIIAELEAKLKALSESCENIVRPLREAVKLAQEEIRQQKIEKWVLAILVGAAAGYAGYRLGRAR